MEKHLKERLTGAAVLVVTAVIFLPMILDGSNESFTGMSQTNIPPRPDSSFRNNIFPMDEASKVELSSQIDISDSVNKDGVMSNQTIEPLSEESLPASEGLTAWVVQLGSFSDQENAESLVRRLQDKGYLAYLEEISDDSKAILRVRVGPELSKAAAESIIKDLDEKFELQGILLQYP